MTASAHNTLRSERSDDEQLGELRLTVLPDVFNPVRMRTGQFFASMLDADVLASDTRVLDMGTGSGVCALAAARWATGVVAVDINAAAVECTRINARANGLEARVDVRHGDLFEPVGARIFDLVLFNPPFLVGAPQTDYDRAWRSTDVIPRFATALPRYLAPHGRALVLLSTFGNSVQLLEHFVDGGFSSRVFATRHYDNEVLTIFELSIRP
jgi:release factor glutamine methyltransferase